MRFEVTKYKPNELSGVALQASRQVWLAGLGAAVVSRDWIQTEAGNTFRTLVKEGTVVESRAIRFLGDQLETSMTRANALWRQTRATVQTTVKQAADTAVLFVRDTLPRSVPGYEMAAKAPAKRAGRKAVAKTPVKRGARKPVRAAKKVGRKRVAA